VADVEHVHLFSLLQDSENHAVDIGNLAVQQMPRLGILRRLRAKIRPFFEAQDGVLESPVPMEGGIAMVGVYGVENQRKVSLRADCDINEVGLAVLRNPRRTLSPAGPYLPSFASSSLWRIPSLASAWAAMSSNR
jgi:hypothetical protein